MLSIMTTTSRFCVGLFASSLAARRSPAGIPTFAHLRRRSIESALNGTITTHTFDSRSSAGRRKSKDLPYPVGQTISMLRTRFSVLLSIILPLFNILSTVYFCTPFLNFALLFPVMCSSHLKIRSFEIGGVVT